MTGPFVEEMKLIDLTHSRLRQPREPNSVPVIVRSVDSIHLVPLDRLVTIATVVDVRARLSYDWVARADVAVTGVADIGGCILMSGWCESRIAGTSARPPVLTVDAAVFLLEGGVKTVASDFPLVEDAADLLLYNNCVLVYCVSGLHQLTKPVVRLVALPLKYEGAFVADARVIAIED